jgi:hypothetical protein
MNLKEFVNPSRQFRPSPFWSWNEVMDPSEIENRIRDMKRKGFGGFFMHARQGLRTKYLSDDWMRAIRRGVETARELEIEAWLYDEDRWPSGFAGGKTTEGHDEFLALALTWAEDASSLDPDILERAVAFTRKGEDGRMVLIPERPDDLSGAGVFYERRSTRGQARYNGEGYSDLLNPDAVREFLDNTYERYSKLFRYDFGKYMPGIFTDEPNVNRTIRLRPGDDQMPWSFPWTPGFADYFEKIHGYSPLGHLHHLLDDSPEGFKFRHDYWRTVSERFVESYSSLIADWCRERELLFTGHYLFEDDFRRMILSGGSVMAHYEYLDVPGIDHLGRRIGNPWTVKQAASVANQLGKKRVVSELFGAAGQDLSLEDMKWIADYNLALGITFLCPHLVQYSLQGNGKRDFPPTFSYHQPYWEQFRVMNDYLARVSWAVSRGKSAAETLVLHPIGSACGALDMGAEDGGKELRAVEASFRGLADELLAGHVDFDLGDERILIAHGAAEGDRLKVGEMRYRAVVLPYALTWLSSTLDLLDSFTGPIILMGEAPGRVSGEKSDRMSTFVRKPNIIAIPDDPGTVVRELADKLRNPVTVLLSGGDSARSVLVNHRIEAGAHLLFLANTDRNAPAEVVISLRALGGVVELDPLTGRGYRYASEHKDGLTVINTTLHAAGSRIFLVDQTQTSVEERKTPAPPEESLVIGGPYSFQRMQDNILVLDRCTLEMDGKSILRDQPVWKARRAIWERTGIAEFEGYQPWVMEARNVRTRTNKTVLTFEFTVQDIPEKLELTMESAERFTIEINGKTVETSAGKWHIDRKFPACTITEHVVPGQNVIRATTDFLWDTEIENIYLAGDFAVGSEADGFPLIREPELLETGNWVDQGYPFYPGSMTYRLEFELDRVDPFRYELDLSAAKGSMFNVTVNGTEVGVLAFPPYRGDITGVLKPGANSLEVEVIGALRNTLGPLHYDVDNPEWIGPREFSDEEHWTDSYRFVPYGFIGEPKLVRIG